MAVRIFEEPQLYGTNRKKVQNETRPYPRYNVAPLPRRLTLLMEAGFLQMIMGQMISMAAFGLLMAGVLKMFRMSNDLNEIKDLLRDIKREGRLSGTQADDSYTGGSPESAAALMRAVNAASPRAAIHHEEPTHG
jgi:hypothetical protein